MAKTKKRSADSKLETFAEDLGRLLGNSQNKAEDWLNEHQAITTQLTRIRDTASSVLERLKGGVASARGAGRQAETSAAKGRKTSATSKKKTAGAKKTRRAATKKAAK